MFRAHIVKFLAVVVAAIAGVSADAASQPYPSKPIEFVDSQAVMMAG